MRLLGTILLCVLGTLGLGWLTLQVALAVFPLQ